MKLVPTNREKLGHLYKMSKNQKILQEFIDSGEDCVELIDHGHASARNCQTCLCASRRKFGFDNVGIAMRGDKIYLYRKDC